MKNHVILNALPGFVTNTEVKLLLFIGQADFTITLLLLKMSTASLVAISHNCIADSDINNKLFDSRVFIFFGNSEIYLTFMIETENTLMTIMS